MKERNKPMNGIDEGDIRERPTDEDAGDKESPAAIAFNFLFFKHPLLFGILFGYALVKLIEIDETIIGDPIGAGRTFQPKAVAPLTGEARPARAGI